MFHEPSLPASTWPMMNGVPPGSRVADRVTVESGSDVPEKSGCVTLVTSTVPVDRPLSDAGLSCAGQGDRVVGDGGRVCHGQPRAAGVHDEHLDRVVSRIAGAGGDARIGIGVRAATIVRRADAARLADRAGRDRGAVAPVDGGREVGVDDEPLGSGLASVNEATGPLNSGGANTGTGKIDASAVSTVGWVAAGVSGASAMMAEPEKIVTEPPSSVTVTV